MGAQHKKTNGQLTLGNNFDFNFATDQAGRQQLVIRW